MYKYILNQMKRSVGINASFCFLLALAGTLLCLGTGLFLSAVSSARDIDNHFTTIALPDASAIRRFALNQIQGQNINEFDAGYTVYTRDDIRIGRFFDEHVANLMLDRILLDIDESVYRSGAMDMDARRFFGAFSPEIVPIYSSFNNPAPAGNSGGSAAFVAQVTQIEEFYEMQLYTDPETGGQHFYLQINAYVDFAVEEILSLHPNVTAPRRFFIHKQIQDTNGGFFFTEGERYVVAGYFEPQWGRMTRNGWSSGLSAIHGWTFFREMRDAVDPVLSEAARTAEERNKLIGIQPVHMGTVESRDAFTAQEWEQITWQWQHIPMTDDFFPMQITASRFVDTEPLVTQWFALGDMDYAAAVASGLGNAIEHAVSVVEKNANRLNVITTNNINSIYYFNQNRAVIAEGRAFTREEYEKGVQAVIIPRTLAEQNGLEVGDTLTFTFFEGSMQSGAMSTSTSFGGITTSVRTWWPGGFEPGMAEAEPAIFEIVGIYTAPSPRWQDLHAIPLNTIFIPDNAFGEFTREGQEITWQDDRAESPLLNVIIIPNGRTEEFRRSVNAMIPGYGNFFMFYDQGYAVVRPAVDNLMRNGSFILALTLAGWVVAAAVFCLFFILRKKRDVGFLYAMGIRRQDRFRWVFVQCLVIIVIAQGIAYFTASRFYDQVFEYTATAVIVEMPEEALPFADTLIVADGVALEFDLIQDMRAVPLGAAVGFVLLSCAAGIIAKLMNKNNIKNNDSLSAKQ
jgi:hypothetical protein